MKFPSFVAIVLAAGKGERLKKKLPKAYVRCHNMPLIMHSLNFFADIEAVEHIVIVISKSHQKHFEKLKLQKNINKKFSTVLGGETRQSSVFNALKYLQQKAPSIVCIHDAARPIIDKKCLCQALQKLYKVEAIAPKTSVYDSIVNIKKQHEIEYIERQFIYRVQTPQCFRYQNILAAHENANKSKKCYDDDFSIAKQAGLKIEFCKGQQNNIKVTDEETLKMAERLLAGNKMTVTAFGYDSHVIEKVSDASGFIMLGNVKIRCDFRFKAHSDGDVLLHALCDALYGCLCKGDIGYYFPPSQKKWQDVDSIIFLQHALAMVQQCGGVLQHIDTTILAQKPKISPFSDSIRQRLSECLTLPINRVNIKAKTNEAMGFIGRGEGIAALVSATLTLPCEAC